MEAMQALMKRMQLSEAEKKGIRICEAESGSMGSGDPKAIGKVLAEKVVNAEGLAQDREDPCRLGNNVARSRRTISVIFHRIRSDALRMDPGCLVKIW